MIMAETDAPTGRLPPLTNGFQQIFLFFRRLDKKEYLPNLPLVLPYANVIFLHRKN